MRPILLVALVPLALAACGDDRPVVVNTPPQPVVVPANPGPAAQPAPVVVVPETRRY